MTRTRSFPRRFYARRPEIVARALLGKLLVRELPAGRLIGRIVEAEAYLPAGDSACHAYRGRTKRNASMYGPPGHAYVYAIHSRWCLNTVTAAEGIGCAVLLRAIEPLTGINVMQVHRGTERLRDLGRGPARLCEALDVNKCLGRPRSDTRPRVVDRYRKSEQAGTLIQNIRHAPHRRYVRRESRPALHHRDSEFVSGSRHQNEPTPKPR